MGSLSGPPSSAPTGPARGPAWLSTARTSVLAWRAQLAAATQTWRLPDLSKGLGVKLDVDMLTPALTSVKQQYSELPQPLREVLPFAGVSLVTGAVVGRLHQGRYAALRDDREQLQAQMAQLEGQMSEATMKRTGAFYEIQMAEAVAKAATAAAAAATAAAAAAQSSAAAAQWPPKQQQQQQQQRESRQPRTPRRRRHLVEETAAWRSQPRRVTRDDASASSWLGGVSSARQQAQQRRPTAEAVPLSMTEDGGDSSGCSSGSAWEEEPPGTPSSKQPGAAAAAGARRWRLPFLPR